MSSAVLQWVAHYGYFAIFGLLMTGIIGLPVPDEWLLTFSGYLVFKGELQPLGALAAAFLGSSCGISVSYVLGDTLGLRAVHRFGHLVHLDEKRLVRVHAWYDRIGKWLLVIGFFLPGIRHLTAIVAGLSRLRWPVFCLFAYTGALLWTTTFLSVGYLVGERWQLIAAELHRTALVLALAGGGGILLAFVLYRWWQRRRRKDR